MPTLVIKPNPALASRVTINDLWFSIDPGAPETFTDTDDLKQIVQSRDLPGFLVDDAFGAGNSTLILNDGTSDIPQADAANYLQTVLLPTSGAYSVAVRDNNGDETTTDLLITGAVWGDLLFYDTTGHWVRLPAGTSGQILQTNGAGADPTWVNNTGGGSDELVKISANDTTSGFLNGKLTATSPVSLTENNDGANETLDISFGVAGQAQGDILYFDGTNWVRLGAGTSGQVLRTNGAGANPTWVGAGTLAARIDNVTFASSSGSPYQETTSGTYEVQGYLGFAGTDVSTPTQIAAVVQLGGGTNMAVRVVNDADNSVIAELTGITDAAFTLRDLGTLTNLTATASIWRIEMLANGGGRKGRLASLSVVT